LFLPVHVFPNRNNSCRDNSNNNDNDKWRPQFTWIIPRDDNNHTAVTRIPRHLQTWAQTPPSAAVVDQQGASFGYLTDTATILFRGNDDDDETEEACCCLWSSSTDTGGVAQPRPHAMFPRPTHFLTVSPTTVCFQSMTVVQSAQPEEDSKTMLETTTAHPQIYCTVVDVNGTTVFRPVLTAVAPHSKAIDFKMTRQTNSGSSGVSNNTITNSLWFKKYPSDYHESGFLVFSWDPTSMLTTLYSQRVAIDNNSSSSRDDSSCSSIRRHQAVAALVFAALPVTVASGTLWITKRLAGMGVATYVGWTLMFVSTWCWYTAKDDDDDDDDPVVFGGYSKVPWSWWFASSGGLWLFVISLVVLGVTGEEDSMAVPNITNGNDNKATVEWGLITGGLAYTGGTMALLLNDDDKLELYRWIILTLWTFIPLIVLGTVTQTSFLTRLGAMGFLLDCWRFAVFVSDISSSTSVNEAANVTVSIQILVFSLTGLVGAAIGNNLLCRYQRQLQVGAATLVRRVIANWRGESSGLDHIVVVEEDSSRTPLLSSSSGTFASALEEMVEHEMDGT
jgi:hypothetical protein